MDAQTFMLLKPPQKSGRFRSARGDRQARIASEAREAWVTQAVPKRTIVRSSYTKPRSARPNTRLGTS
jgi:hypothetical protein